MFLQLSDDLVEHRLLSFWILCGVITVLLGCHTIDVKHRHARRTGGCFTQHVVDDSITFSTQWPELADGSHSI